MGSTGCLKFAAIVLLIQSILGLIFWTIWTAISTAFQIVSNVITGKVGQALLGLMILWFASYIIQDQQVNLTNGLDSLYCNTASQRQSGVQFASVVFPQLSPFLCLWDWGLSFTSFFTTSFLKTAVPCVNYETTFIALKDFVGTILQSVVTFLFFDAGPTGNKFDFASIFQAFADFVDTIRPIAECVCDGIIDLYDFIVDTITDKNLGCGIDQTISAVLQFAQGWWNVFYQNLIVKVNPKFKPSLTFLNSACAAVSCFGDFFDNTLVRLFDLFVTNGPNLRIGCIVSRLRCLLIDLIFIVLNIAIEIAWDANFDAILQTDFTNILDHLAELAGCVQAFFGLFDKCLGQTIANVILLLRDIIRFSVKLVQQGDFDFNILASGVLRLVGQATYGNGAHVGRTQGHNTKYTQTSLTCLVSKIFAVTGGCGYTTGDFVNSILEFILIPLELVEAVIDNSDLINSFADGNPLDAENRPAFNEFLNAIFNVIIDRLFGIFDYIAHIFACPEAFFNIGAVLVRVVFVVRQTWSDIQDVLITFIDLVLQSIVLLFTLFGASPFENTFDEEVVTWVEIFIDILLIILEVLFEVFITLVDYILFPYFPLIFGQQSLLTYTGTAPVGTFTNCIANFAPDCICGLTLALANKLCLPAGIGCLGDIWPGCGAFQTTPTSSRKREYKWDTTSNTLKPIFHADELPYADVFDYFATEFPEGWCGSVFAAWKNGTAASGIGELDAAMYVACLGMIHMSSTFNGGNNTDVKVMTKDGWLQDATKQSLGSFGALFLNQMKNAIAYTGSISCMVGDPQCGTEQTFSYETDLDTFNINNPIARDIAAQSYDLFEAFKVESVGVYNDMVGSPKPYIGSTLVALGGNAASLVGQTLTAGRILYRGFTTEQAKEEFSSATSSIYTWATGKDWTHHKDMDLGPDTATRLALKKRHHNDGPPLQKQWMPQVDEVTNVDPNITVTSKAAMLHYKMKLAARAFQAWGGMVFGTYMYAIVEQQRAFASLAGKTFHSYHYYDIPEGSPYDSIAPFKQNFGHYYNGMKLERRGIWKDIKGYNTLNSSHTYSPLELGKVHTNLTFIYGTGGYIQFANHIPDSCTRVGLLCPNADPNSCPSTALYENFGLCQDFLAGLSIVTECSSVPGNEFQAFAVYTSETCSNNPSIVVFANATSPTACKTLNIGGTPYFFCVVYNACQACPVEQLIPGFNCALLDQTAHRAKEFGEICLALFLGIKTIDFSLNFTTPIATSPEVFANTASLQGVTVPTPSPTPFCTNVCGNGILEDCEQCDDNNMFSNDGCSYPTCRIEKCPTIKPVPINLLASRCSSGGGPGFVLSDPATCIPIQSGAITASVQISCIPKDPMLYKYPVIGCPASASIERTKITLNCSDEPLICLAEQPIGGVLTCLQGTGIGKDFTCARNCYVCGNGVLEPGEECDQNPYTSTTCSYCLTVCTPTLMQIGIGTCRFGSLEGIACVNGFGLTPICNGGAPGQCLADNCFTPSRKRSFDMDAIYKLSNYSHFLGNERLAEMKKRELPPRQIIIPADRDPYEGIFDFEKRDLPAVLGDIPFVYNDGIMNYAIVQKSNSLTTWIGPVFDKLYNYITNGNGNITTTIINHIDSSIGNSDFALDVPFENRSIAWYPVFAFWCRVPGNFLGQVGMGLWDGTWFALKWIALVFVIAGLVYEQLPTFVMLLISMFGMSFYLGVTFGYSSPGCTLLASPPLIRVPIFLFDEALDVMLRFNGTYINWPAGFVIAGPTNGTCTGRETLDCQTIGFFDGIDEWYFLIQWWKPEINTWINDSVIGRFLDRWDTFSVPKQNFTFTTPTLLQQLCFWINITMLSQPVAILTVFAIGAVGLAMVLYVFLNNLGLLIFAIADLIGAFQLGGLDEETAAFVVDQVQVAQMGFGGDYYQKKLAHKMWKKNSTEEYTVSQTNLKSMYQNYYITQAKKNQ